MKIKQVFKLIVSVLTIMYPMFILLALTVFNLSVTVLGDVLFVLGVLGFFANRGTSSSWMGVCICIIAVVLMFTDAEVVVRFYPICVVLVFLGIFGGSLLRKKPIIFQFAQLMDKSIKEHPGRVELEKYCKHVTEVWVLWFIINLIIDIYFVFYGSVTAWAVFNGPVCWGVQCALFAGEFIVRYFVNNRVNEKYNMPKQGFWDFFKFFKCKKKVQAVEEIE